MKKIIWLFFILFAFNVVSAQVKAEIDLYHFSSEDNRLRYLELTKLLRCPKCQNQDIADSHAPIAADMRKAVHRLLEQGQNNQQVIKFMTDRFGEFVSYKPRVTSSTYLLWYGPWLMIILGLIVILLMVKSKKKKRSDDNDESADKEISDLNSHNEVELLLSEYSKSKNNDLKAKE